MEHLQSVPDLFKMKMFRERERERQRDRETERQRDRQRHRERQTETDRHTDRQRQRQKRQTGWQINRQRQFQQQKICEFLALSPQHQRQGKTGEVSGSRRNTEVSMLPGPLYMVPGPGLNTKVYNTATPRKVTAVC